MNLNEILKKNILTEEEYIFLKKQAYNFATNNSGKEILNHIEQLKLKELKETNAILIYFTTLIFPNDIDFINEYTSQNKYRHSIKHLKEQLKMPEEIIKFKVHEMSNYHTQKILNNNIELRRLAETLPHFETKNEQSTR